MKKIDSLSKEIDGTRKKHENFRTEKCNNKLKKKLAHDRIAGTEERISALEVRSMEIIQFVNRE